MRRRHSFGIILVGKTSLLKEGLAEILRSANFRILSSVSCTDDFPTSKAQPCQQLFLIVQTGENFSSAVEQVKLFRSHRPGGRIAIVADRYRLDELVSAFRAGVNGYFVDVMTSHILIKSLELVMMGEAVFPPHSCHSFSIPKATTCKRKPPEATTRGSSLRQKRRIAWHLGFRRGRNQFYAA